jgi:hypothetical protein
MNRSAIRTGAFVAILILAASTPGTTLAQVIVPPPAEQPRAGERRCAGRVRLRLEPVYVHVSRVELGGEPPRAVEIFQRLNTLAPGAVGAEELTPEELPFLRFDAAAQELFDAWRADLEHRLRAEEDHPVLLSHLAKYRSLLPSLALILHLIDGVDTGRRGPVVARRGARVQRGNGRNSPLSSTVIG